MKKKKHEFSGKCEHCHEFIKTDKVEFSGSLCSGIPLGLFTRCPKCGSETKINLNEKN